MPDSLTMTNHSPPAAIDPADVAIARADSRRRRRRVWLVLAGFVFLVVGYILSPGVFVMMEARGMLPPEAEPIVRVLFAPLEFFYNRFPVVEMFYDSYFEVMGVDS